MMLKITENDISMTKGIFPYTILGLTLISASCSQDDMSGVSNLSESGRIEFRASLPEITSRATEADAATLNNFMVSSFIMGESSVTPHFLYKAFSRNEITRKFVSSDPECIWPNNNDELRFVAFFPSCEDMRQAGGFGDDSFILSALTPRDAMESYDYKLSEFRIAGDIASQTDFVTAIASGRLIDDEENDIDLEFRHQLSRIELNAWGASKSFDLEIAGVRLGGVGTGGTFSFVPHPQAPDASKSGVWESVSKGKVEYIFREGDKIVVLDKTDGSPATAEKAVSIMGAKIGGTDGYDNSAMLIPWAYTAWDYKNSPVNGDSRADGMYLSVLVRVTDTTPYDNGTIVYPYADNADGMEVVYLAVDAENNVKTRLYRLGDDYFTDDGYTQKYDPEAANGAVPKAFGWAALPVTAEWKPGYVYTYTLNYTNGVGLHAPEDSEPGKPIISDKVIIDVKMIPWERTEPTDVTVPRK